MRLTLAKGSNLRFENGSIGGAILSFTLLALSLYYFFKQKALMDNFAFDSSKSETITNNMREFGNFKMKDFNFMPSLEI